MPWHFVRKAKTYSLSEGQVLSRRRNENGKDVGSTER